MNKPNPKVDTFLSKVKQWKEELHQLRFILLKCELKEEFKWKQPCYTFNNNNVIILGGFKDYCAIMFFKGVLVKDTHGVLVQQTEHVQAGRQIRFTNVKEIKKKEALIKEYIQQAINVEKSGLKVNFKKTSEYIIPKELQAKLDQDSSFKTAFEGLTPGRQRGYILHFSKPKQSTTRLSRIEKCMPKIFNGKGLNDF